MITIAGVFASAVTLARPGRGRLRAPQRLQSWPGIVHGGGLLAALDDAAARAGLAGAPRVLEGRLTSSVPVETELDLDGRAHDGVVTVTVLQDGQTLTSASVTPGRAVSIITWTICFPNGTSTRWPGRQRPSRPGGR